MNEFESVKDTVQYKKSDLGIDKNDYMGGTALNDVGMKFLQDMSQMRDVPDNIISKITEKGMLVGVPLFAATVAHLFRVINYINPDTTDHYYLSPGEV